MACSQQDSSAGECPELVEGLNMVTKYGIPQKHLDEIVSRDVDCIYCHKKMLSPYDINHRADSATIEHLNHRTDWDSVKHFVDSGQSTVSIIGICCGSCNSSRGSLSLLNWFKSDYCMQRNISKKTASKVVRDYINEYER